MLPPAQTFVAGALPPTMTTVSEVCARRSPCDVGHHASSILYCPVHRLTPLYRCVLPRLPHWEGIAREMTSVSVGQFMASIHADVAPRTLALTVEEAAEVLRFGRAFAYQQAHLYLDTGGLDGIPIIQIGGCFRVPRWRSSS